MKGELQLNRTMFVMDTTGDTRIQWDSKNTMETFKARDKFKELKDKGYMAYTVNEKGDQGKVITDFDPEEERIIMVPPMVGG